MKWFSILLIPVLTMTVHAQENAGWTENPEIVAQRTEARPAFNFHEDRVPAYELPDPLAAPDGSRIATPGEWRFQRQRILELFRHHVYGRHPGRPDRLRFETLENDPAAMEGRATLRRVAIVSEVDDRSHRFELILFFPNQREKPAPAFLLLNNRDRSNTDPTREVTSQFWPAEEAIDRGYAIATFFVGEVAPIDPNTFREGIIRTFEGDLERRPGDAWGALAAWAWGAQRVMDYFEADTDIDATRVAVLGHSRGGKAALWTGAQDERFALTISNESGCGGAALSRRRYGETVARINRNFPYWFCDNFNAFNDNEEALPVDQHMLVALMAPRAVYVGSADEDLWCDPRGEFLALAHASDVFALWGHEPIQPGAMPPLDTPLLNGPRGYHIRSGGHNLLAFDWHAYMDLADRVFRE